MPVDIAAWVGSNLTLVVLCVIGLVAAAWAYEAFEEAEDRQEAVKGFGARAKSGTGGVLNVVLVSVVSLVGWAVTTFQTAAEALTFLISLGPEVPILTASLFTISLGAIGLSDLIVLRVSHFLIISVAMVALAVAYRTDFGRIGL